MKIKLKAAMNGFAKGQEITIVDDGGIPVDPFWRRRLKDAEIDNSIEIVQNKSIEKKQTKPKRNSGSSS